MGQLNEQYRKALVTGASSGLGEGFTRMLVEEGIFVIGLSRKPALSLSRQIYEPFACDLSSLSSVKAALDDVFARHEDIDLVINNAGFGVLGELSAMTDDSIEAQYAVMLLAPVWVARRALRAFKKNGQRGCLVNVASLASELPIPLMPVYNSCKAGLSGLSDSLALDLAGSAGTTKVVDFRPGDFRTPFAARMEGEVAWNGLNLRAIMDRHHRNAPPVARAVADLKRTLRSPASGRVRTGSFFQAVLAPWGARLLPASWLRRLIRFYYRH